MKDSILEFYEIFRKLIIDKKDELQDLNSKFFDVMQKTDINCDSVKDESVLKLAIISSHAEWEVLYKLSVKELENIYCKERFDRDGISMTIGEMAKELTNKGMEFYDISYEELKLLRKEIIYNDNKYKSLIDNMDFYLKKCNENHYLGLRYLTDIYLKLHRLKKVRECLKEMKEYIETEVFAPFDIIMLTSRLYEKIPEEKYDLKEIEELLTLFEHNEEMNSVLGVYDHNVFLKFWIKGIRMYLNVICKNSDYNSKFEIGEEIKNKGDKRIFEGASYIDGMPFISQDYIENGNESIIGIMKKHDELLIKLINTEVDPSICYEALFPGTQAIINRMLLNMDFPDKFDYFMSYQDNINEPYYHTDYDFYPFRKSRELYKRLLNEFPQYQDEIKVEILSKIHQYSKESDDEIILELEPLYQKILKVGILKSVKNDPHTISSQCINTLIDCYLHKKNYDIVKEIIETFKNLETIVPDYEEIVEMLYNSNNFKLVIEVVQIALKFCEKLNDIPFCISNLLLTCANSFVELGKTDQISIILKYFEEGQLGLSIDDYEYTEIKELISK